MSRTLVFVPMYNCERQIARVLDRIGPETARHLDHVLIVDNGSRDGSIAAAIAALSRLPLPGTVLRNDDNYNLGGSHKVAFTYAITHGFDHIVVLHGDDQADINDAIPLLSARRHLAVDALLGSRFSTGARREGYSRFRIFGNLVFNGLFSLVTGRWLTDLGSGLNILAVAPLQDRFWIGLADDLTFNNHLLLALVNRRAIFKFFPISWREEDQVSNVRLFRQARRTLGIVLGYGIFRGRYLWRQHALRGPDGYTATVVHDQNPAHREPACSMTAPS